MIKTYQVEKDNYQDAGKASSDIKRTLKALGIDRKILKAVAIACYEAEINIAIHSNGGTVTFEIDDEGIVHLAFDDIGPGIENLELALTPGYSTASPKARELGLYMQKYCGCVFSEEERYANKITKDKEKFSK